MMFGKMVEHFKEVRAYTKRLNKAIEKLEAHRSFLGEMFLTTKDEQLAYEYNSMLVRTIAMLNDLYQTRNYIKQTGNIVEFHSCKWFIEI